MSSASCVWLLSLVLCWGLPSQHTTLSSAAVYYVTPHSPNPDCPSGKPCFTINEYAQGNYFDGDDNITLLFLNGEHNLTAQNLIIDNKTLLILAPSLAQSKIIIQMANGVSAKIQKVIEVEISSLKLICLTQSALHDSNVSEGLSLSDIGNLLLNSISIESCKLSLLGKMQTTITKMTATRKSLIYFFLSSSKISIKNSEFYHSTLDIADSHENSVPIQGTIILTFSLESSKINSSDFRIRVQSPILQTFMILNSSFTSEDSNSLIYIEMLKTAVLHTYVKNCSITGNYQGIQVIAQENSSLELNVEHCYMVNKNRFAKKPGIGITAVGKGSIELNVDQSYIEDYYNPAEESGGITVVAFYGESVVNVTCISSTFVGNYLLVTGSSSMTRLTVLNCTLRGGKQHSNGIIIYAGKSFNKCMSLSISETYIENTSVGILASAIHEQDLLTLCEFEIHLNSSNISSFSNEHSGGMQGLGLMVYRHPNVQISITDSSFSHNKVAAIWFQNTSGIVAILRTVFLQNDQGISIVHNYKPKNAVQMNINISVESSIFLQNVDGVIIDCVAHTSIILNIADSIFQENKGVSVGVDSILTLKFTKLSDLMLNNVTFYNNSILLNIGIVQVDERVNLSIGDLCVFRRNHGTPVHTFATNVTLSGEVLFENNVVYQGGAILLSRSMLKLVSINQTNTSIMFSSNTATNTGGGIYVESSLSTDPITGSYCFYEIQGVTVDDIALVTMVFINNTAINGGDDIYGATPNSWCHFVSADTLFPYKDIVNSVFKTDSNLSAISSDPKRVCLSDSSQLVCANLSYIFYNTTHYPGEVFTLSLAVVGLEFGIVTGPVYAFLLGDSQSSLGSGQRVRQVLAQDEISKLNFTVNSINSKEVIGLSSKGIMFSETANKNYLSSLDPYGIGEPIPEGLLTISVYINIELMDCPLGFQLDKKGACICGKELTGIGIYECMIFDKKFFINRSGNQWVQQELNSGILASKYCPFNYCKQTAMQLNLNDPDKQCALNHTGILCGACTSHLSLVIGSSRCLECHDDYHVLLLIAFAAAGVLLVLFINVLNVTVAMGTINGLIFYANIIWANQSVLFPPHNQTSSLLLSLKVFTAWLNLDLGIETCFIQGLDGYGKTWLQLAFPAYIWLIAGLIILVSHYSIRVTRILGGNSVSVLATLFLLSYAKLLHTILIVLEFTVLEYPDSQHIVWSFDGNIMYFGLKHSILFVVAVIILLFLWLPYTLTLLFIKCLRRCSHHYGLRWVNKLTPFFDSYTGPLKDKHHYWIGLGLLARLVLLLTSTVTLITMPYIAVLLITLLSFVLGVLVLGVYKQWLLGLLEVCFLFNLTMFCSGALLLEAQMQENELQESKDKLACTSLMIAFLLFLVIFAYHVWRGCLKRRVNRLRIGYENIDHNIQATAVHDSPQRQQSPTYQEVSVPALREPLLEST